VNSEHAEAQGHLSLPPASSWPELSFPSDSVTSRGARGSFAVSIAQSAWECYWVWAIRDGDAAGQRRAHAALGTLMANNIVIAPNGASEN
jgi:hypothetical protein